MANEKRVQITQKASLYSHIHTIGNHTTHTAMTSKLMNKLNNK